MVKVGDWLKYLGESNGKFTCGIQYYIKDVDSHFVYIPNNDYEIISIPLSLINELRVPAIWIHYPEKVIGSRKEVIECW